MFLEKYSRINLIVGRCDILE